MSQQSNNLAGEQPANALPREDHGSRARSLDAIFELLVTERRRNALYVLYRSPGPLSVSALAEEVAALEGADPERVATALHHVHLPKLADAGVVEYDGDAVRLDDLSERFRRYLATAAEDEQRRLRATGESATLSEF
ncbi:hypothetical protein NGM10_12240 [Halorussus salilacus]|uniref:DUF7344 domain-containing protein n=1 Tax=Halorussus salilacus TaxID=2953750 RepID=UPI00209F5FBB|nr:hypothetical protein [Halorussus salilacus]USZ67494.1 hypothetical protein NGM10_12240 [Halorussus salilacus]